MKMPSVLWLGAKGCKVAEVVLVLVGDVFVMRC